MSEAKLRILIIISHYLPGERAGGPVRSIVNMIAHLADDFEFWIITRDRDVGDSAAYPEISHGTWHSVGRAQVCYLAPHEQGFTHLASVIKTLECDVLYINGVFDSLALKVILLYRLGILGKIPTIVAPRGQWTPEVMNIKPLKKKLFMVGARLIDLYANLNWYVSSASEEEDVEREVGKQKVKNIQILPNLPMLPQETPDLSAATKRRGELRLIFLSRIVNNKGLHFLLDSLRELVDGSVYLDIYGSKEDLAYWASCQTLINKLPGNINVAYKGVGSFNQVLSIMSNYHLFVLPTLSENYGHVIIEALMAGCPTLISNNTPWQDLSGAGWVLPLEEQSAWISALQEMLDQNHEAFLAMRKQAIAYSNQYKDNDNLTRKLRQSLVELVENRTTSND